MESSLVTILTDLVSKLFKENDNRVYDSSLEPSLGDYIAFLNFQSTENISPISKDGYIFSSSVDLKAKWLELIEENLGKRDFPANFIEIDELSNN